MPTTPKDVRGGSRREGVVSILRSPATPEEARRAQTQEVPHRRRAPRSRSPEPAQVLQHPPRGHQRAASEGLQEKAGGHEGGAEGDLGGNVKTPALLPRGRGGGRGGQ